MALTSLAAVVVLAACGGDDDGAATTADVNTTVAETPTTETAAPETTEAEQPDDSGADAGMPGVTAACLDATQAMGAAVTSYSSGIAGAVGGTLDDDQLQQVSDQLRAVSEAAPDEIKGDLGVIATEVEAFYTAWAEIGYTGPGAPTPEQIEQIEALGDVIDQEAFDEAADNIEAWFEANC
ncbi:MAG TPA: hypothetical protein VK969_01655 [Acidimicrobiia bacterium]|nr:hypothetical protein [Acidimicrobiia bacterium]